MNPATFAHFLVYSLISLYASRVVYLIGERVWVALRRWYELRQIWNVFESDMDSGFIAEHNAKQRLEGGPFDRQQLIDATLAEMFPKRSAFCRVWILITERSSVMRKNTNFSKYECNTPNRAA